MLTRAQSVGNALLPASLACVEASRHVGGMLVTPDIARPYRYISSARLVRAFGIARWRVGTDDQQHGFERRAETAPSKASVSLLAPRHARAGFDHGPLCRSDGRSHDMR